MPENLAEVMQYDVFGKQLQWHSPKGGGARGVFQGHGASEADAKENILRFLREIDKGLRNVIGKEQAPLVVACVDYLLAIYREANTYPYLLDKGVSGNPEGLSAHELHAAAWDIVRPPFKGDKKRPYHGTNELAGTGRTAKDLQKVVEAARNGRVEGVVRGARYPAMGNVRS